MTDRLLENLERSAARRFPAPADPRKIMQYVESFVTTKPKEVPRLDRLVQGWRQKRAATSDR